MATHSSIIAWKIPWTEEPGRLQFMDTESDMTEHSYTQAQGLKAVPEQGENPRGRERAGSGMFQDKQLEEI